MKEEGWKEIRDAVHGQIEIHPLCVSIIDTPEFQRLRNISQCGLAHLVYPSACHSRFEHCIGVYYLAGLMLMKLEQTEKIDITDKLCVQIAALCHDLGHGPFSHAWEHFLHLSGKTDYKHEDMSSAILEYLVQKNNLSAKFDSFGITKERRKFIGSLIKGHPEGDYPKKKYFLYEIVANEKTGVDVDKWDYMLRDALHFGMKTELNYERILSSVTIMNVDGLYHVAFRDKVAENIIEMYENREKFHKIGYQHRVCKNIETMLIDALLLADEHYKTSTGKKLSECHSDLESFVQLSDYLYYVLLHSMDPKLSECRQILERITRRKLYTHIGNIILKELDIDSELENKVKNMEMHYQVGKLKLKCIDVSVKMEKLKNIILYNRNSFLVQFPCEKIKPSVKEALLLCTTVKGEINKDVLEEMEKTFKSFSSNNNDITHPDKHLSV